MFQIESNKNIYKKKGALPLSYPVAMEETHKGELLLDPIIPPKYIEDPEHFLVVITWMKRVEVVHYAIIPRISVL